MSKRATPRTRTPVTSRPSRAVRDAIEGRNNLLFGLPIGMPPPAPVVVFWLHALNNRRFLTREGAYGIAAAHNEMVEEALRLHPAIVRWDYLVWLETDHTFNAPEVFLYIEHLDPKRYPIVGFLYVDRMPPALPVGFDRAEDGSFVRWDEERMAEFGRHPGLHPVTGGVPMGVTAIHRSVFEALPQPWYYDPPDGSMSDDIWFCQQAIAAGFPVHVATQFEIGHWGSMRYDVRHYWAGVELGKSRKIPLLAEELLRKRIEQPGEEQPTTTEGTPEGTEPVRQSEPGYRHVERRTVHA